MNNTNVYLENGEPLGPDILGMTAEELSLVQREESISDAAFKTESISYGKDVWRRFRRSKVTVVSAEVS